MTALTAARATWYQQSVDTLRIPMAALATIYQGSLVCVDADGYAVPGADTADYKFAGMAVMDPQNPNRSTYDNSAGADGDMYVVVRQVGRARFVAVETPVQAMLFAQVFVSDDQTVAVDSWNVTNDVRCGHVTRLPVMTLADDPQADFSSDEVEIQFSGDPFLWHENTTTTTTARA